tara:strand:- start:25 stop:207 length:183 start_codon:yes stop_codon:yes gene_type:complete
MSGIVTILFTPTYCAEFVATRILGFLGGFSMMSGNFIWIQINLYFAKKNIHEIPEFFQVG